MSKHPTIKAAAQMAQKAGFKYIVLGWVDEPFGCDDAVIVPLTDFLENAPIEPPQTDSYQFLPDLGLINHPSTHEAFPLFRGNP